MRRGASLLGLLLLPLCALAQPVTLSGRVVESGNGKPLPGVTLTLPELGRSLRSDDAGRYRFELDTDATRLQLEVRDDGRHASRTLDLPVSADMQQDIELRRLSMLREVQVVAERSPDRVGKTAISGRQLGRIAGSGGDPMAGLQALPGVVTPPFGNAPAIRGSAPGDNAYYVDDLPARHIFHAVGISVFDDDIVRDFNLYSAAFPPHYRNVTGAVIDVALRDPKRDRLHGKAEVGILSSGALLEGPVNDKQSFLFSVRRSYADLLVKQIENKGITVQLPVYHDYQGKYLWDLGEAGKLTFHVLGASDKVRLNVGSNSDLAAKQPVLVGDLAFDQHDTMQAATWDALLAHDIYNKLSLHHYRSDASNSVGSAGRLSLQQDGWQLHEQMVLPHGEADELSVSGNLGQTRVAVDANIKNATCTQFNPACDLTSAQQTQLQDSYSFRSWDYALQERKRIHSDVTLVGGVRHSYENYLARSYTEPRLGIEWEQSADTLYTAGWGRHNQMPVGQQVARNFGNPQLAHLRADHSVLGVTHKMDDGWSIKSETYLKRFRDLVVDDASVNYVNGGSGKAYGVEFLLKKDSGPEDDWSGWLSLSLARSSRFNDITGQSFRFALDQPVNATLVSTWRMNEDWTLDARWQLHSGTPYTPINGSAGTYADGRPIPNYGALNSGTLPVYHRLDIRLEKEWLHQHYAMKLFLEFNNVYFRKNVVGYTYDPTYTKRDPVYPFVLPLAFGMQVEF